MFGYLRFILAFFVVISHLNIRFYSLNPGVIAVTIFYILAGYVTSYLFFNVIPNQNNKIVLFYVDRIKRIFPLYIVVALFTIAFLLITDFGNPNFSFIKLIYNFTIIPLNYYMYIDSTILSNPKWQLIPPAWSLGTELQSYLLLPFALLSKRFFYISLISSFTIYIVANMHIINSDYFGYRFIFGVFFIFLIGSLIQRKEYKKIVLIYIFVLAISLFLFNINNISGSYAKETLIGLLIGIPIILLLSNKVNIKYNKTLGKLSYALFLSHFLFIWIFTYLNIKVNFNIYIILLASIFSIFLVKIEKRIYTKIVKKT